MDVAFLHDVLHHVEDKAGVSEDRWRATSRRPAASPSSSPSGPKGPHKDDPKLQVTKAEMTAWMADLGLVPSEDISLFEDKWYVIYARK